MCAVFGYVGYNSKGPDLGRLRAIAGDNMRRGPHAWGMAWIDQKGRLKMFKQTGRIVDALGLLAMAKDAQALIGHCRWATHGDPSNNLNNHPHPVDGGWFVHNGVVSNHLALNERHGLETVTDCDSETLGLLIERDRADALLQRCTNTASKVPAALTLLGLWSRPARFIAVRSGNPLCFAEDLKRDELWLASLPDALPGKSWKMKNGTALEITPSKMRRLVFGAARENSHGSLF